MREAIPEHERVDSQGIVSNLSQHYHGGRDTGQYGGLFWRHFNGRNLAVSPQHAPPLDLLVIGAR